MNREEVNKVVETVCDYFHIDVNKLSLQESNNLYNQVYHSVNII